MKYASDFRTLAREALSGRWGKAVLAGFLATLLGAAASSGPELNIDMSDSGVRMSFGVGNHVFMDTGVPGGIGIPHELQEFFASAAVFVILLALVSTAAMLVLSSVIRVGYSKFNLTLVDYQSPEINQLFSFFPQWKTAACVSLLQGLYILLWSLLLIIPGIIAGYSYAMTGYIQAEHPELTASQVLERSKEIMEGNRWRLFCLEFSFIGWEILAVLTLGIGNLWLLPYKQAATAAFYREIAF